LGKVDLSTGSSNNLAGSGSGVSGSDSAAGNSSTVKLMLEMLFEPGAGVLLEMALIPRLI
jgi:hypothetical protein